VANFRGRFEEWAQAVEQELRHARLAGQQWAGLSSLPEPLTVGPRAADEALRTIDALAPDVPHPSVLLNRARFLAMLGRFEEAWPLAHTASDRWCELVGERRGDWVLAQVAELSGDYEAAARFMRRHCDALESLGHRPMLSTYAPLLGRYLCVLGRYDEAAPLAHLGRELGDEHDVVTQALWRQVQALVHASRGEQARGETLAREAVELAERTDSPDLQGDALADLADVLASAGRTDEAADALEQALDRYERKKNLALVAQVRPRLEELRTAVS
jgi:ATP/maltotriose-dependent transcriptional regulator MalT